MATKKKSEAKPETATEAVPEVAAECAHGRTYVCEVGPRRRLVQRCPDCGERKEAPKGAIAQPRPMPLGHPERCAAQCTKLEAQIARQKELIAAAGPESDEGKALRTQLKTLGWKLGHAEKRVANAAKRAAK